MKSSKTNKTEPTFSEDELGVPEFHGKTVGDKWEADHHDPFERMVKGLLREAPKRVKDAAIRVHDGLNFARAIAVSIYGRKWEAHVIEVFDRLQLLMHEDDDRNVHPEDPEPDDGQDDAH
jgi:hypothetical protein